MMKHLLKAVLIIVLCLSLISAPSMTVFAEEPLSVTVNDGTYTDQYVPFYSYYNYGVSQTIVSASELSALKGHAITAIKYYRKNVTATVQPTIAIYLTETNDYKLNGLVNVSDTDRVFSGRVLFNSGSEELTVVFNTPYNYSGKNLIVTCFNNTGTYTSSYPYFYGVSKQDQSISYSTYRDSSPYTIESLSGTGSVDQGFAPKMTFVSDAAPTPPDPPEPSDLLDTHRTLCMTETVRLNYVGFTGATWISDNSNIATVDSEGNVTGVGVGSTVIRVESADGAFSGRCNVNVTFLDVTDPDDFFYTPVYWAVDREITSGYTGDLAGLFGTHDTCTRGQIVTFLYRAFGSPAVDTSAAPAFKDVKKSDYFYKAVCWAAINGVTSGYTDSKGKPTGKFGPNDPCTRGQVVTFLYRAAGSPSVNTSNAPKFKDVKTSDYFYKPVCWAALNGITSGYSGTNKFGPNDPCERCQVVTFLYRARF